MPKPLYSLAVDDRNICTVSMDVPDWMPVNPRLNGRWLRYLIASALRNCLRARN